MFQSPICFQCFVPVRCDHWVRGRSYLSSPQQAALQAAGHANLETGCLAGKTVLMDTGLGCPKSFFSLTAFRGRLWKHHNSSSKTSLAATCLWYPFNSSSEHLQSRKQACKTFHECTALLPTSFEVLCRIKLGCSKPRKYIHYVCGCQIQRQFSLYLSIWRPSVQCA